MSAFKLYKKIVCSQYFLATVLLFFYKSGEYIFEVHTFAPPNSSVWLTLYHKFARVRTLEVHADNDSRVESKCFYQNDNDKIPVAILKCIHVM